MIEVFNATCYSTKDLARLVSKCEQSWKVVKGCEGCFRRGDRLNPPKRILFCYAQIQEDVNNYYYYVNFDDTCKYAEEEAPLEIATIGILAPKNWPDTPLLKLAMAASSDFEVPRGLIRELTEIVSDVAGLIGVKGTCVGYCDHSGEFVWEEEFKIAVNGRAEAGSRKLLKEVRLIEKQIKLRMKRDACKREVNFSKNRIDFAREELARVLKISRDDEKYLLAAQAELDAFTEALPELRILQKSK